MTITFSKYQGTGNDFIMINNLSGEFDSLSILQIKNLCDRRYGIGADGLIKINSHSSLDFEVDYYNADGSKSFCGNGARCSVHFAKSLNLFQNQTVFMAIDGEHESIIRENGIIELAMKEVLSIEISNNDFILDTGSPHFCSFVPSLENIDIVQFGKSVRYSKRFEKEGINVNCIEEIGENKISILTYERGVEDETLSCGTGATAAAVAYSKKNNLRDFQKINVKVKGGELIVSFKIHDNGSYSDIKLIGPATCVFKGKINA